VSTETAREGPEIPVAPPEAVLPAVRAPADLAWTIVQMRAGERITVNEGLIAAYQAASSPHSIRALKSDVEAFDAWCRRNNRIALPATPETVADYLDARAGKGSRPASLSRYKASIAKIHQLLELKDPTPAPLVKLRLQTVRREKGLRRSRRGRCGSRARCATSSATRRGAQHPRAARELWRGSAGAA
jgi:hypothetical protein